MIKILLIGEGGQGVQTIAKVIAQAAQKASKMSAYIPSFGVEQRGGVSLAFIQIDDQAIPYPRFDKADIIVSFCNRAIEKAKDYITNETIFIYDDSAIEDEYLTEIKPLVKKSVKIPAQKIAQEKYTMRVLNTILLGATANFVEQIKFEDIETLILEGLKDKIAKDPKIKELNINALNEGRKLAQESGIKTDEISGAAKAEIQQEFKTDKITWKRFPNYCKGCSLCIVRCPVKALSLSKDLGFLGNPMPIVDMEKCIGCKMCQKTCPDAAIKVDKK